MEAESLEQLVGPPAGVARLQVVEPAEHDAVLASAADLIHRGDLADETDPMADVAGLLDHVVAGHLGSSGVRSDERCEDPDRGGLPGADSRPSSR